MSKLQYKDIRGLVTDSYTKWNHDKGSALGAALAYYTVFSLAPLIIILISVAGLFFSEDSIRQNIMNESQSLYGPQAADYLNILIDNGDKQSNNVLAAIIGFLALLLGATGVFGSLKQSLNIIWKAESTRRRSVFDRVTDRVASLGMVLSIGFLLIFSLVVSTLINSASMFFLEGIDQAKGLFQLLDMIISFGVTSLLFGLVYRFIPNCRLPWNECLGGGVVTATLFVWGKFLLGLYLGSGSVSGAYGAAGSFVLILLWIYYSAQIFYFGAELVYTYAKKYGSLKES